VIATDVLRRVSGLALQMGSETLAAEAEALAERVEEGRFYVVCVGQFKRGKSTLLNALVGAEVLPTGVIPVTTVVTVMRHGEHLAARVRLAGGEWKDCDPGELRAYVSEEQNPGNQKAVTTAEVFVPSPLLASGMCLVDTPGIGSVWTANTETTRAFVPHVDAALVVVGADPPISGEELALVQDVARQAPDLVVVLTKADRQSDVERAEALRFTDAVLAKRLGRPVGPILQVSATEALARKGAHHDWEALVVRLTSLARESGSDLVSVAAQRGLALLLERVGEELDEQERALRSPLEESQARVDRLRASVDDAERSLEDLGHRLAAVEERLYRTFGEERERFFGPALADAERELAQAMGEERVAGSERRRRAIEHAIQIAKRWLQRWRAEQEPRAEGLYREAVTRFVELVNACRAGLVTIPGLERLPALELPVGLSARSRFHYTEMLAVAPESPLAWILDLLLRSLRTPAIERDTRAYLRRLLEVNSARIKNDFQARVVESRRLLEGEIRSRLRELAAAAERALERARDAHAAGAMAVAAKLDGIALLRSEIASLRLRSGLSRQP
jgi:GTP-binding protein EngB required for normal cell division